MRCIEEGTPWSVDSLEYPQESEAGELRHYDVRAVRVEDEREATDGTLWRVPNVLGAEGLDVRVRALRGPTFTVRIDDQDSPALEGLTVSAVLAQPALVYFSQAATLRFGGGRVRAGARPAGGEDR